MHTQIAQWKHEENKHLHRDLVPNGEEVAASECRDLADVTEGCAHHNSLVAKPLVIVVDLSDASHSYVE